MIIVVCQFILGLCRTCLLSTTMVYLIKTNNYDKLLKKSKQIIAAISVLLSFVSDDDIKWAIDVRHGGVNKNSLMVE